MHFTGSTAVFNSMWKTVGENIGRYRAYPRLVGETGGKDFIVAHPSADPQEVAGRDRPRRLRVPGAEVLGGQPRLRAAVAVERGPRSHHRDDEGDQDGRRPRLPQLHGRGHRQEGVRRRSAATSTTRRRTRRSCRAARAKGETGYFIEPTLIETEDPGYRMLCEEIFGPVVTAYVYPDAKWHETLASSIDVALRADRRRLRRDRKARARGASALRNAAGNFYINDKPTGAVVGQQPFGRGARVRHQRQGGIEAEPGPLGERADDQGDLRAAARLQVSVQEKSKGRGRGRGVKGLSSSGQSLPSLQPRRGCWRWPVSTPPLRRPGAAVMIESGCDRDPGVRPRDTLGGAPPRRGAQGRRAQAPPPVPRWGPPPARSKKASPGRRHAGPNWGACGCSLPWGGGAPRRGMAEQLWRASADADDESMGSTATRVHRRSVAVADAHRRRRAGETSAASGDRRRGAGRCAWLHGSDGRVGARGRYFVEQSWTTSEGRPPANLMVGPVPINPYSQYGHRRCRRPLRSGNLQLDPAPSTARCGKDSQERSRSRRAAGEKPTGSSRPS